MQDVQKEARSNYLSLVLPLSVSLMRQSLFNLSFILPHSQYHPQSVLQHSPMCQSLQALAATHTFLSFPQNLLTNRQWSRKQSFGLEIKSSQQKAKDVISNISYSLSPHGQQQKICLLFTYTLLYIRVPIISAHGVGDCCRIGRQE